MDRRALVAAFLAVVVIQAAAWSAWGLRATPDSVEYVSMAESLARGEGTRGFTGDVVAIWPPGYAFALAPGIAIGLDPFALAPWLHAVVWTLAVFAVVVVARDRFRTFTWRVAAGAALLAGAPVVTVQGALVSEGPFTALLLGALVAVERSPGSRRAWIVSLVLAAVAPVVRLLGVALWPAVAWAAWRRGGLRALAVAAAALPAPLVAWLVSNRIATGGWIQAFPGDPRPLDATIRRSLEHLARWIVPQVDSTDVLLISAAVVLVAGVVFARRRGVSLVTSTDVPWLVTGASLLAVIWIGSTRQRIDLPDLRLLAPVYVTVVVSLARIGDRIQSRGSATRLGPLVAGFWVATLLVGGADAVRAPILGDPTPRFAPDGEVARALEGVPDRADAGPVWSNYPELVHWHRGVPARWTTPRALADHGPAAGEPVVLVWFSRSVRTGLVGPRALHQEIHWDTADTTRAIEIWTGRGGGD